MTVWWGLAGLLGLLGCCGLLRGHRASGAVDDDPLARYPAAREPATPNADAAHTPLMTPAITPEMLAGRPGSGRMSGEIPAPRPEEEPAAARVPAVPQGSAHPAAAPSSQAAVAPQAHARHARHSAEAAEPDPPVVPQARSEGTAEVPAVPPEPGETAVPQAEVPAPPPDRA
jgi:hypothetical protein